MGQTEIVLRFIPTIFPSSLEEYSLPISLPLLIIVFSLDKVVVFQLSQN
jgi:hypothetical protein